MSSISRGDAGRFIDRVADHLTRIYPDKNATDLAEEILRIFFPEKSPVRVLSVRSSRAWSSEDILLITYGNSIVRNGELPLQTLLNFMETRLKDLVNMVHLLPFFPYSSDDGFAVMDYYQVNPALGTWEDILKIARRFSLMADLVINHTSSRSGWFENFKQGKDPGRTYYLAVSDKWDISRVVRPRTSPLLKEVNTPSGVKKVWCTFSHDQVDLDFRNPDVLLEWLKIIQFYLAQGVKLFRLDAVAFLWKKSGTACLHLDQTYEVIRLIRTVLDIVAEDTVIVTETNVPEKENVSYLGYGDMAHVIYNFPLPPLVLHTFSSGSAGALYRWLKKKPDYPEGTTGLNFLASHDGIGLRPVEDLLGVTEIKNLIECMKAFGGRISTRALNDQKTNPYEINISLWDAFKGTRMKGPDKWQLERFVCAHAVMLCLKGIPAIYIHSILGTPNDTRRANHLSSNRAINRHKWDAKMLDDRLADNTSHYHRVFERLSLLIRVRKQHRAFHPCSRQKILDCGDRIVGILRQPLDKTGRLPEQVCCLMNISNLIVRKDFSEILPAGVFKGMDLVSGSSLNPGSSTIEFLPYQFVWIGF